MKPSSIGIGFSRPERAVVVEHGDTLLGRDRRAAPSTKATIAARVAVSFQEASRHCPVVRAASSFSTTWSMVKLAALLSRWELLEGLEELGHHSRRREHEVRLVDEPVVVGVRGHVGALERVDSEVEDLRDAKWDEGLGPHLQRPLHPLLHEHGLPVVEADREHVAVVGEVDEQLARASIGLAGEMRKQVEAVDVHLEGRVAGGVSALSFSTMSGLSGRGEERRQPVVMLDDLVGDGACRDLAGPPHHQRDPERALPSSCSSRCGTASSRRRATSSCAARCRSSR